MLDALVLELLEKETLNQEQLATIFAPITKRPPRQVWLSSEQRAVSERPPVMTPAELAAQNGHPIIPEDEAGRGVRLPVGPASSQVPPSQTPDA